MSEEKKNLSHEEELDRFWDIDSLLPKKKHVFQPVADTTTAEIEIDPISIEKSTPVSIPIAKSAAVSSEKSTAIRRFIPPHTEEEEKQAPVPQEEYTPDHALIRRVRIYRPKSNYQYYEAFVRDAIRLYPIHGEPCERVPFFSYVPQYSQMSRPQLEWYLWWRECVRNGECLQTDYSYVLLYLYELINLSEKLEPQGIQDAMLAIWEQYRDIYRQLDGYLSEWICDFSLLHRLAPPKKLSNKIFSSAMTHCTLKEFYFASDTSSGYIGALLAFCNNYDYRKSKFCVGENAALFEKWIPAVLNLVIDALSGEDGLFSATKMDDSRVVRNAFTGALCACSIKRNIEVEYCSFSRSNELRYFITDVIKYTENMLRAHLGIRSRLSVYSLPNGVRERIDRFLAESLPPRAAIPKAKRTQPEASYEKLYDLPQKELSLTAAAEIERASWSTTERLIEAFGEDEETIEVVPEIVPTLDVGEELSSEDAFQPYLPFLLAVQNEDFASQRNFAKGRGEMPDAIADAINEIAVDVTGDILIEDNGDGYTVIEDYEEVLQEILNHQ